LTISRTANRDNSSNYYINDKKSNFKEVTDLLKGKGIDLDNNRFLILQGEVEQISMMKPKGATEHDTGLLEYLEDIIGTDKYIEDINNGAKRLEVLNEKRQGIVARVKIAEKERDALEGEKTAAEAYISKEIECLSAQRILSALYVTSATRNVEKIEGNIKKLEDKLAHEREKFKEYNDILRQHEDQYNAALAEHAAIQKDLESVQEEFKEFERKDIKHREDLKHLKAKIKKLDEKSAKDAGRLADLEAQAEATDVPALHQRAADLSAKLVEAEAKLEELVEDCHDEVEGYRQQLQAVRAELAPWESKMTEVQSRIDVASSECDMLVKGHEDAQKRYEDAKTNLKAAEESAKNKSAQITDMEAKIGKYSTNVEKARSTLAQVTAEVEALESQVREVRGQVSQRKADTNSQVAQGAVVKALMEAKAKGQIDGIYGRLGDLGAIPKEYDVAVSTACPALDYIVVETTSAAQRCVELLRQRQLGVATFLILEKQAHLASLVSNKLTAPEGVPRLFDLVKCSDNKLKVAFFYAMRNTVVATDLEQASRIAYGQDKRWSRVVTMAGEMINETGTMSGGGGKPRGGKMCLGSGAPKPVDARAAAVELEIAEVELEKVQQKLATARATASEATANLKSAEKELYALETAIPKTRMEADAALERASDLQNMLAELQAAAKVPGEEAARLKALTAEIENETAALQDLQSKSEGLSKEAKRWQDAIENAGGDPLRRQRSVVTKIQSDIAQAEADATKKEVAASAATKQLEKLRKDIQKSSAEKEKLQTQLETTMSDFKALEDAAFKVLEAVRITEESLKEKETDLEGIRTEFEAKQKEVGIIRSVEVDIAAEVDGQKGALKEESYNLKGWAAKSEQHCAALSERVGTEVGPATEEEMKDANAQELQYRIKMLEEEMERMNINLDAIDAWKTKDAEHQARVGELDSATAERDDVRKSHEELRKRRLDEFMAGFNTISLKLKEMYQMITMGGDAELELVDSLDPFSEGILFSVRPPKKSWKNIANLSGGEKTLSSLSLVFALHHYKPTPLYVMDEIDAALDFKNVSIVGHYIKERTKNAQFVIISLRNNMFELADRLVGIYKTDNATKSVAINPGEFVVGGNNNNNRGKNCNSNSKGQFVDDGVAVGDQEQLPPVEAA
jgi:structural maintenance of chromosome 4